MRNIPERIITQRQWWLCHLVWVAIALLFVVDVIWIKVLGWSVDWPSFYSRAAATALLAFLCIYFTYWRKQAEFAFLMHLILQLLLFMFTAALFSYVTATLNIPLYDDVYIAFDRMLGFDWHAYVWWVRQDPLLSLISTLAYSSALWQTAIITVALFFAGNLGHLQRFFLCIFVGALATCILSALFPAVAGYVHFNIDPSSIPGNHIPFAARVHEADLLALREGSFRMLNAEFKGIVTFPSFHTTYGILLIYAAWPFKYFRWLSLILNILLVLSVPVDGGHYVVDAFGGAVIAFLLIWCVRKLMPSQSAKA